MLYDIHDHDDGADLLISAPSLLPLTTAPLLPAAPLAWLDGSDLSGAVVPGPLPGGLATSGGYEFRFRNGYGALVTVRGTDLSVRLQGDWLPSQDREEVFGMDQAEVTTFLRSVEALPAPDFTDLGEF